MNTEENKVVEVLEDCIPPADVFRDKGARMDSSHPINFVGQSTAPAYRAHFMEDGGVLLYHEGEKFPTNGWPFKQGVLMADIIRRSAVNALRFCVSSPMRYFLPLFFLLPGFLKKRIITSAIFWYSEFTDTIAERMGAYWEPKYLCTIAREVYRV